MTWTDAFGDGIVDDESYWCWYFLVSSEQLAFSAILVCCNSEPGSAATVATYITAISTKVVASH